MNAKRGFVPEDKRNFSPEAMPVLRKASRQVAFLLDEGYDPRKSVNFVGNHYLLSERQRLAVMRSSASAEQRERRKKKQATGEDLRGRPVVIDGFNQVITLEVLLSDSPLFLGMDGAIRDLAALRGTYRIIPETRGAVDLMLRALYRIGVSTAVILLDEPVSNSGRLKTFLADFAEQNSAEAVLTDLDIRICRGVDRELMGRERVITSDSVILDRCESWFNLTEQCLALRPARVLQLWE